MMETNMKLPILAASVSILGAAANAGGLAAPFEDPVIAAPVAAPVAAPFNWTGGYAGVQAGAIRGNMRLTGENLNNNNTMARSFSVSGGTLGIYGGYNWHAGGNTVYGVEGEISASNADGTGAGIPEPSFGFLREGLEGKIRGTAAIRGRVGLAQDRTLFYLTGGVAFADTRITGISEGGGSPFSDRSTRTGWTIGAGIEHAVTDEWTVRADYRFADFGNKSINFESGDGTPHRFKHRLKTNEIRLGVARRF
jgi:outer membrane immunogenic protein